MDEERQNLHDNSDYDESEKLYEVYLKGKKNSLSAICQMLRILIKQFFLYQVPVWGYHWFS